jgi:UPF0716 protein FxsA
MSFLLFLAFVAVPLIELYVIIQVGRIVGALPTVVAVFAISVAGAALVKAEGLRAWRRFSARLNAGRLPAVEVLDGPLLLVGGALLVTPGFVTDAVGLLLVAPPSRRVVNRLLRNRARAAFGIPSRGRRQDAQRDEVIDVEVVRVDRDERPDLPERPQLED